MFGQISIEIALRGAAISRAVRSCGASLESTIEKTAGGHNFGDVSLEHVSLESRRDAGVIDFDHGFVGKHDGMMSQKLRRND